MIPTLSPKNSAASFEGHSMPRGMRSAEPDTPTKDPDVKPEVDPDVTPDTPVQPDPARVPDPLDDPDTPHCPPSRCPTRRNKLGSS